MTLGTGGTQPASKSDRDSASVDDRITPEIIEKVARHLFRIWKEEIRIERERRRDAGRSEDSGGFE